MLVVVVVVVAQIDDVCARFVQKNIQVNKKKKNHLIYFIFFFLGFIIIITNNKNVKIVNKSFDSK